MEAKYSAGFSPAKERTLEDLKATLVEIVRDKDIPTAKSFARLFAKHANATGEAKRFAADFHDGFDNGFIATIAKR